MKAIFRVTNGHAEGFESDEEQKHFYHNDLTPAAAYELTFELLSTTGLMQSGSCLNLGPIQ